MQYDFLLKLTEVCSSHGIHTCLDTTGYMAPEIFKTILDRFDLFLFDIKTLDNEKHIKYTGVSTEIILTNLRVLSDAGKKLIVRFPVIPGVNDDKENINEMKNLLNSLNNSAKELHLLPFHAIATGKYQRFGREFKMNNAIEPNEKELNRLKSEFEEIGYNVRIGG